MVQFDERAPYNLLYAIICVECGAEECGANFHAVTNCLIENVFYIYLYI